jgi:hypothetical protein
MSRMTFFRCEDRRISLLFGARRLFVPIDLEGGLLARYPTIFEPLGWTKISTARLAVCFCWMCGAPMYTRLRLSCVRHVRF